MKTLLKLFACSALLATGAAHASLVQNGSTITDTTSNLDWMPLTASTSVAYPHMLLDFGDRSSQFYGYQYATLDQLEALFTNAGYSGDFGSPVSDKDSMKALGDIFKLFGQTGSNCCARGDGALKGSSDSALSWVSYIPVFGTSGTGLVLVYEDALNPAVDYWDQTPDNLMGNWIVKRHADAATDVPEPGSLALMALGFGALAIGRRTSR